TRRSSGLQQRAVDDPCVVVGDDDPGLGSEVLRADHLGLPDPEREDLPAPPGPLRTPSPDVLRADLLARGRLGRHEMRLLTVSMVSYRLSSVESTVST